jgi:hypothetical protein
MTRRFVAICLALICVPSALAQDRERILGTWKLETFDVEFQDSGERKTPFGANPNGYIIFTRGGRMMAVLTAEGRKAPRTDSERAEAFRSMYAYSGTYQLEGDRWVTRVDTAWNEAWTGTDQLRNYRFEDEKLIVTSAWAPSPNFEGRTVRGILSWVKVK